MSSDAPINTSRVRVARALLVSDLAFAAVVSVLGVRDVLDPPTTLCGRAQPSLVDAGVVLAAVLPLAVLGILLIRWPTHTRYWTVAAAVAVMALTLLAISFPAEFSFQNGFCIAPF